jgi:signal transduction histidine kinase
MSARACILNGTDTLRQRPASIRTVVKHMQLFTYTAMQAIDRNDPAPAQMQQDSLWNLMDAVAYLTVAVGYLFGITTARHLSVATFLLFTALNVAWLFIFRYLSASACQPDKALRALVLLGVVAGAAQLSAGLGLGFDWLLPAVTVSLFTLQLSWRSALISSGLLFATIIVTLVWIDGTTWGAIGESALTLAPVFPFVVAFSYAVRRQQELRERAEELTVEVSRAKAELEEANAQLRKFSAEVEELAITRERNRVAREIHDTLGHGLTILAVQLETATKLEEHHDSRLHQELVEARRVVAECLTGVRSSVAALRPSGLTAGTFETALRRLVTDFEAAEPAVEVTLDIEGPVAEQTPEQCVALFRCAQESLTNVRKHACATKVLVRLRVETDTVELTALDNGHGTVRADGAAPDSPGFGLIGMRERVALLGGNLTAGPEPEHGWRVEVRVPRAAHSDLLPMGRSTHAGAAASGAPVGASV